MIANRNHLSIHWAVLSSVIVMLMVMAGCSSTPAYTYSPALSSITINLTTLESLPIGSTQQLTAIGTYSNGYSTDITSKVIWKSSDITKATVSSSGLVTGVSSGTTDITASMAGITSPVITLMIGDLTLSSIVIKPEKPSDLMIHTAQKFTATGIYSDGSSSDITSQATWTSSVPAIIIFHYPGIASAVAAGTTDITASMSGMSSPTVTLVVVTTTTASTTTTITSTTTSTATTKPTSTTTPTTTQTSTTTTAKPKLSSITITANQIVGFNNVLMVGLNLQFTATGIYSDGSTSDLSTKVTWRSSDTSKATISSIGLATGVSTGTTDIIASMSGIMSPAVSLKVVSVVQ